MTGIRSGDRLLKQADLNRRAAQAASGFSLLGISEGDAVAVILRNDFAFFEAALGAALLGAYVVPVNWHFKAEEISYILRDSEARVVVVHADLLESARAGFPSGIAILVVPTPPEIAAGYQIEPAGCLVPPDHRSWETWLAGQDAWNEPPRPSRINVIYTSGTTGRPKGVMRPPFSPEGAAVQKRALEQIFGLRADHIIRTVVTGPVYHSAPNLYALASSAAGGDVVLQARFDPRELLRLIEEHRITHLHMVPTMFVRLLKLPDDIRSRYDLSSLEFVVHGAAPCAPDVKRAMIDWWGPVIHEYYGGTETGAVVFHNSDEALRKPGTVGRAVEGATLRIIGDDGCECPPGEAGEIYVIQPGFDAFTYKNQDAQRKGIERDGLVSIGDIGYLDEDGYLFLCDRAHDMVISGGVNIYPAEIEAVLQSMPGIRDCAVLGIPDEEFGESLCAHVDVDPNTIRNEEQVRAWLVDRIAGYKVPGRIIFDDQLPREDSGKIVKRRIRDKYWQCADRKI
jgi:long-chain acyl-CoA synthetase